MAWTVSFMSSVAATSTCSVDRDVFVPLCSEKSRWTAVAMLGVIKAGGIKGPWTSLPAAPGDALYAVFTSGSTGTPKGVVSNHSSSGAAIRPYSQAVEFDKDSRFFQFASYAFDVTIFDTLMALINGGCICVPSDDDR
ncbi:uncharacterized protein F4812DRAFT_465569 [Daldinia caldariorum]|uniref:uncharacterized protein n=1 Tax=Daldinia caldariorum TaxID=326644 RepID=UPI0020077E64|nr:uncharacterized protein F4812DRAFT_465569 [Daldinia caldariorum]KAI1466926.1 hypothetical protein F4812DRAFT_465569 [Daldinia caldariorum]